MIKEKLDADNGDGGNAEYENRLSDLARAMKQGGARVVPRSSISTSTSRCEAIRAYGCCCYIARRLGEGVFSPSSTSHRRWIRCKASTVSVSARTRRRNVGFRRDLVRWIQDFERNPRSPYLLDLLKGDFELELDTMVFSVDLGIFGDLLAAGV
ncbi:uncharacterized protein LOC109716170 [Ananas comosus]|uniref:Uncharacterized protein LOC109716170 n=1 Tax=Ananas comosus TaxID=4615 RepID=A0A6P5FU94_ANACO|nr:uncharacterized protein LOC109716170 [Ananas comosus]